MQIILQPYHILLAALVGWANERQRRIIDFQNDQIQALLKKLGKKRLLLTDDQRRVLAVKGHALGRKALLELTTIVTPDTILRWHGELVAKKWDHSDKRKAVGRPRIRQVIVDSLLRFARENPTWSYDRIQGALANVGYHIADWVRPLPRSAPFPSRIRVRFMPRGHDNDFLILDFGDTNLFRDHYLFVHRIGSGGVQSPPLVCEIGTWLEPAR